MARVIKSPNDLLKRMAIPTLPRICRWLNGAINDPRASTLDVAEVVGADAALTARLLRLVNSAFYGFPARIETPAQAVMIIGTTHLCDLALTASIARVFKNLPGDLVSMESFWRHSIACGLTARVLASRRHELNVERFFVAGMLHDIGWLVICQQVPALARQALQRAHGAAELLHHAEREVLGFDHAAIGAALVRAWGLPPSLEEAVACHHEFARARRFPLETALVHVGDVVAHALRLGASRERFVPPLAPEAWELIELSPRQLPEVVQAVEEQADEVARAIIEEAAA